VRVYDATTRREVLARVRDGETLRRISLDTGISRATLREWRERDGRYGMRHRCPCPRCSSAVLPRQPYLYLLGQYLGDGCICRMGRTWVLRVSTCDAYPQVRAEVVAAMSLIVANPVHVIAQQGCASIECTTKRWLHLFPQHGPGRKHERPIVLEPWQLAMVAADPRPLIRGLLHSDGCRVTNWTERRVGHTVKRYEYPRYLFSNRSDDIRGIFTDALDAIGIAWKQNNRWSISVARRDAVAALDRFVGPKA
jgi:hypothetical protein